MSYLTPIARALLIPGYSIECKRCDHETIARCDCRPRRLLTEMPADGPAGAHEPGCSPPARCPHCRAPRWWLAPLPRKGRQTWKRGGGRPRSAMAIRAG